MKYLIINADDFGMCHAMNAATIGLLEDNLISSATLMAPCIPLGAGGTNILAFPG
jgi:chitin disaccharide deacetylase